MLGAIAGDIIGSVYEANNVKTTDFPLFSPASTFTDDTVLTVAVADALLNNADYIDTFKACYAAYPDAGYGGFFHRWAASSDTQPYNSWGNGSAMRVSPVGFACTRLDDVLAEAERSAAVTHNHPQGIVGAQATACAVFLARTGHNKSAISAYIEDAFQYDLHVPLDEIRPRYSFDVSCQGSVPQALRAFLEGQSYEDTVRKAISLGGDSDTLACIAGGVAEAYYGGVPAAIRQEVYRRLDARMWDVIERFYTTYRVHVAFHE